jgi:serine/threonine protein phosphatase PrpC
LRRKPGGPLYCVHGGTTATVVVLLDGCRLISANTGDSAALLCRGSSSAALPPMRSGTEWVPLPGDSVAGSAAAVELAGRSVAQEDAVSSPGASEGGPAGGASPSAFDTLELTSDHSPESASEFTRMARARPARSGAPHTPDLLFVYDSLSGSANKSECAPIFEVAPDSGILRKTSRGAYFKNVRSEWATLVATPRHADFQDALAFTRSLGDFHLQAYGVTHVPDVRWMDLAAARGDGESPPKPLALVLASDGLWDNWKPEEVASAVISPSHAAAVQENSKTAAKAAADALMDENLARAAINFGDSADNMTLVVAYLIPQ